MTQYYICNITVAFKWDIEHAGWTHHTQLSKLSINQSVSRTRSLRICSSFIELDGRIAIPTYITPKTVV